LAQKKQGIAFAGVEVKSPTPMTKAVAAAMDIVGIKDNFFISDSIFTV